MKKFFTLILAATCVVGCQSRKEPVATMELEEQGVAGDTLVSVYEGWAESQDGASVLYDLVVLTPPDGGDISYEMMMSYYDATRKQDTTVLTPALLVVEEGTMAQQPDSMIQFTGKKKTVKLSWQPVSDPSEPNSSPREYIVYTRIGYGGFDNGELVRGTSFTKKLEPGLVYSFKVTAVNRGGESFPSEILSAYQAKRSKGTILIINGFDRLSGPATIDTYNMQGFDMQADPGVPYLNTAEYCGNQLCFNKLGIGKETKDGLGYSDSNYEGMLIAGNTFDYPFIHGKAIQAAGRYSFVSCSNEAVENGLVNMNDYRMIDLILGVELQPFSTEMKQLLTQYCQNGGYLFASGAHLDKEKDRNFTNMLKYIPAGNLQNFSDNEIFGTSIRFNIYREANEKSYAVPSPSCIVPAAAAITSFAYTGSRQGAGVSYKGNDYSTFMQTSTIWRMTEYSS